MKQRVVLDEATNTRSYEIQPGASLSWPARVYAHNPYFSSIPSKAERAALAARGVGFSYSAMLDLEVPPSALFQASLDALMADQTLPLRVGIARCNPHDAFCRKTGRQLAEVHAFDGDFFVNEICTFMGRPTLLLSLAPTRDMPSDVRRLTFQLSISPGGAWLEINRCDEGHY